MTNESRDFAALKCGGGPRSVDDARLEGCDEPATMRMPYRSVYPQMPVCERHARNWHGGNDPKVWDGDYRTRDWSYSEIA